MTTDKSQESLSYALGMAIGRNLKSLEIENLSFEQFAEGFKDTLTGKATKLSDIKAQEIVNSYLARQQTEKGKKHRVAGEAFLAENAKQEGVKVLSSGLQYKELRGGQGKKPGASSRVKCHYEGRLINGAVFDSSYQRGEPAVFPLNGVIAGWTEGLQLMSEGAKYRFFIPYNLAYGSRGAGESIPPYAALIFDVELIAVL